MRAIQVGRILRNTDMKTLKEIWKFLDGRKAHMAHAY